MSLKITSQRNTSCLFFITNIFNWNYRRNSIISFNGVGHIECSYLTDVFAQFNHSFVIIIKTAVMIQTNLILLT